jgi:hypothetical protein
MTWRSLTFALVVSSLLVRAAGADWKEPADKQFTEDQLKLYLETEQDWRNITAQMMQQVSDSEPDAAAVVQNIDQKYQACLDRHHISNGEFEWIARRAAEAWDVFSAVDQGFKQTRRQLDLQTMETTARLAEDQKRLAIYQKARTDGIRVMTPADRDAAIKSARDEQQSELDEAKQHADDAAKAAAEAAQHDADAQAADDLAANPPADVSTTDQPSYIERKKTEAQSARDAARDARNRQADAKKAQDDAVAKAASAEHAAAHPEIPLTEDDRAAVKSENDLAITIAQQDIKDCDKELTQIAASEQQMQATSARLDKNVPAENVAIIEKYADQYEEVMKSSLSTAATRPSP